MRSFQLARYLCQCRLLALPLLHMCNSMCFGAIFRMEHASRFLSCDHLLWKSDNMHLVCFFISVCDEHVSVQRQLPCHCLAFSFLNRKIKIIFPSSFAQWIWTKSLHLQRRGPAECWPVMWCLLFCFLFLHFFFTLELFVLFQLKFAEAMFIRTLRLNVISTDRNVCGHFGWLDFASAASQVVDKQRRFITSTRI